jgi:hypothetical protein
MDVESVDISVCYISEEASLGDPMQAYGHGGHPFFSHKMKFHTCSQREPLDNFLGEREKGSRRR